MQIGAGIWCGMAFIIAGILTISPGSPTILPLRKVMLIISVIFAVFLAFWTFSGAFIHAVIDTFDPFDDEYNENRWLRVIQGFCAVFEIVLASVTFCQRTSEQESQVTSAPQILVTVQPGYQQGVQPGYQQGVQPGYQLGVQSEYQPGVQPGLQPCYQPGLQPRLSTITQVTTTQQPNAPAYSQNVSVVPSNPPPYSGQFDVLL